jgi:hypothetical protein
MSFQLISSFLRGWFFLAEFQNSTQEFSTDNAGNFHFFLALEWGANVQWA